MQMHSQSGCGRNPVLPQTLQSLCLLTALLTPTAPHHHHQECLYTNGGEGEVGEGGGEEGGGGGGRGGGGRREKGRGRRREVREGVGEEEGAGEEEGEGMPIVTQAVIQ